MNGTYSCKEAASLWVSAVYQMIDEKTQPPLALIALTVPQ